ncbi:minichromosome maintenance domain-containing protein 2-like [Hetaerina americana]|uniref:minichromosome maintenance domain-containing protein 2-like n=1 Tax=Hetaerina americana TaxID=62018 RepID=UPI003A7F3A3D
MCPTQEECKTLRRFERKIIRSIYGPVRNGQIWKIRMNCEISELCGEKDTVRFSKSLRMAWRSGVYSCSDNSCPESVKKRIPVSWKKNPKECHICSSNLVEHTEERDIGNFVKAIVIGVDTERPFGDRGPPKYQIQHGIIVKFYESLASGLKLGEQYDIAGYMTPKSMYAYYVQRSSSTAILDNISWSKLHNIMALKAELEPSPWSFFIAVASQLSSDMYPISSFLHLKRGLLMSLVSLVCMNRPIHVLAVGSESLPAHRLMLNASWIASRSAIHNNHQPVMGKTRWQEEPLGSNTLWLDSGSLFLAQGGICYMGHWGKHHKETQRAVLSGG